MLAETLKPTPPQPRIAVYAWALMSLLLLPDFTLAQPSGGPYGPLQQTYSVPKDAAHVYYVAPEGRPEAKGAAPDEPTRLESAIANAITGDAIVLRGGTYRTGNLKLNQGVTLQP